MHESQHLKTQPHKELPMAHISKYFRREEFACKCGCEFATVDVELIGVLEDVREFFGSPVILNCGCRCSTHNAEVGGAERSKHLLGIAADIRVKDVEPDKVFSYLNKKYLTTYGIGRYNSFTHIDVRPFKARWDKTT